MKRDNARSAGATLSKPEAVWRAIEELGYQAPVLDILEYVKNRFGIDSDTPGEAAEPAPSDAPIQQADKPEPADPTRKPASPRKPRARNDSER